jgi:hypothetical protein
LNIADRRQLESFLFTDMNCIFILQQNNSKRHASDGAKNGVKTTQNRRKTDATVTSFVQRAFSDENV